MSLHDHTHKRLVFLKEQVARFFKPQTNLSTKRLQIFWLVSVLLGIIGLSYGIIAFIFGRPPPSQQGASQKHQGATQLENGYSKAGTEGAWRYTIETSLNSLKETTKTLQQTLTDLNTNKAQEKEQRWQEITRRFGEFESTLAEKLKGEGRLQETAGAYGYAQGNVGASSSQEALPSIQKFTLNLSGKSGRDSLKTVETAIPAGAFAKTILLSGLDASSAMNASSDPRPMLLRIIDYGTLPRKFQSDLKDCHCTASAFGDLSSERVYARLEKLACVTQLTGEIIETQVAGYIAGPDGKAGIRGLVASKDGQFLSRSLMGGVFSGLSNVANPGNRRGMTNPFGPGGAGVPPISLGENFTSGMAQGATSALDRLSQYYIDRAEQLQPVIQVAAGQVVDIVFTEGTTFGSQTIKQDLEAARASANSQSSAPPISPSQEGY